MPLMNPFPSLVTPANASDSVAEAYRLVAGARGGVAHIWQAMGHHGPLIPAHLAIYQATMFDGWALDRRQCELLGTAVSGVNQCRYCAMHHGAPLEREGQAPEEVEALKFDPANALLKDSGDAALRDLAVKLTSTPSADLTPEMARLAELGFTEAQRAHAVLVVAYYNMMNRIANGLAVPLEPDFAATTK